MNAVENVQVTPIIVRRPTIKSLPRQVPRHNKEYFGSAALRPAQRVYPSFPYKAM